MEQHFRDLDRVIKLENDAGVTWKVAFGAPKRHPVWQPGWCRVATDNNFKLGDVIAFVLVGKSHFRFTHFDDDGNRINHNREPSSITPNSEIGDVKKEVSENRSSESHEEAAFVWDAEDEHVKGGDSSRVPSNFSNKGQSTAESCGLFEHSGDEQIEDPPSRKRRRLRKVGEKLKKKNAHDLA